MRLWIAEIETPLGVVKKGLAAKSEEDARGVVATLQQSTNKLEIAYCPPGNILRVYPRPRDKPPPETLPPQARALFL